MATFSPLSPRLEPCWSQPFAKLPKDLAKEVLKAFSPISWDALTPLQRMSLASQIDYNNDPASEAERQAIWNMSARVDELVNEQRIIELLPANVPTEYIAKRLLVSENRAELKTANEQLELLMSKGLHGTKETAPQQSRPAMSNALTDHQRAAARKRHQENYQLREDALQHYQAHKKDYKNMSDAATKISKSIVPMPYRTVYSWIRDWEKIQSAG